MYNCPELDDNIRASVTKLCFAKNHQYNCRLHPQRAFIVVSKELLPNGRHSLDAVHAEVREIAHNMTLKKIGKMLPCNAGRAPYLVCSEPYDICDAVKESPMYEGVVILLTPHHKQGAAWGFMRQRMPSATVVTSGVVATKSSESIRKFLNEDMWYYNESTRSAVWTEALRIKDLVRARKIAIQGIEKVVSEIERIVTRRPPIKIETFLQTIAS